MPLTANYSGGSESVTYQWYKDDAIIPSAAGTNYTPTEAGEYKVIVSLYGYNDKESEAVTVNTFVPVTSITGVINNITLSTSTVIGGTVNPVGATYKDITWTVTGGTASIVEGNKLNVTAGGTATITATITNGTAWGTNYTQNFTVTVKTNVTLNIRMTDNDFDLTDEGLVIFEGYDDVILSSSNSSETLNITGEGITNVDWYLGSIPLAANSNTYTLEYARFNTGAAAGHTLTLTIEFTKGGNRWSGEFDFTVAAN